MTSLPKSIPTTAPKDVQDAFRYMEERLRRLEMDTTVNMRGRRVGNAGNPIEPRDYAHKAYVDQQIERLRSETRTQVAVVRRAAVAPTGGGGGGGGNTGGLLCATHDIDYGYWIPDGNIPPLIDRSHYDENKAYTNMYLAWFRLGRQYCTSDAPISEMMATGVELVQRAFNDRRVIQIMLDLPFAPNGDVGAHMDMVLDAMIPFWTRVKYVDLADEPDWSRATLEGHLSTLRSKMTARGLAHPQLSVTLLQSGVNGIMQSDMVNAAGLDIIGLEAYVNPPGGTEAQNKATLDTFLTQAKGRVPSNKDISIIIQAYARNGAWTDMATLTALQTVAWSHAFSDPRVVRIEMFSYGRASGTREHPELKVPHNYMWAAINCDTGGGGGGGGGTGGPNACGSIPGCGGVNCNGTASCCGGCGNPCNCPRLCSGGQFSPAVQLATEAMTQAHPELMDGGNPLHLLSWVDAGTFINFVVTEMNTTNPGLRAVVDPADPKQMLVRLATAPLFREDFRVINGDLTIATPAGSGYRATCFDVDLTF